MKLFPDHVIPNVSSQIVSGTVSSSSPSATEQNPLQEAFESRQTETADALEELLREIEKNEARRQEQAEKGLDALTYFVYSKLVERGIADPE